MKISTLNRELFIRLSDLHRPNTIRYSIWPVSYFWLYTMQDGPVPQQQLWPQYITEHYLIRERPVPKSLSLYTVQYIRVWYTLRYSHARTRLKIPTPEPVRWTWSKLHQVPNKINSAFRRLQEFVWSILHQYFISLIHVQI